MRDISSKGCIFFLRTFLLLIAVPVSGLAGTPPFANGDFSNGMTGWTLFCMDKTPAVAQIKNIENGKHAVCVTVLAPGAKRYDVQLVWKSIPIVDGKTYKLSFRARSNVNASISVNLWPTDGSDSYALWTVDQIVVTRTWKKYTFDIDPYGASGEFNLDFGCLAKQTGEYWFTDISLTDVRK